MTPDYYFVARPASRAKARRVSYHEAGHAVAAAALGLVVEGTGFARGGGGTTHGLTFLFGESRGRAEALARAAVVLAGPVAESRYLRSRGVLRDPDELPSAAADEAIARGLVRRGVADRRYADRAFAECRNRAVELLAGEEAWAAVAAVAAAIRRRGWLGPDHLARLL